MRKHTWTIREIYNPPEYLGDIGIEIEIEGKNLPPCDGKVWNNALDHSLRGESMEYVTSRPVRWSQVGDTLEYLEELFKACGSTLDPSYRCGVHVHVNIQDLTHSQVFSFACLFYMFETLLTRWCGENRVGNLFCLRTNDAMAIKDFVRMAIKNRNLQHLHDDSIRYAALNWKPVASYGSLEFRTMRTPKNLQVIRMWVMLLQKMYEYAENFDGKPDDIMEIFSEEVETDFLRRVFGKLTPWLTKGLEEEQVSRILREGMWEAQDIAYAVDWRDFEASIQPIPKVEKPIRVGLRPIEDQVLARWKRHAEGAPIPVEDEDIYEELEAEF